MDGAVLGPGAFVLRFFGEKEDRLLLLNLEIELHLDPAPEPLLAPLEGCTWEVMWSSENLRYGGSGMPAIYSEENWRLPGRAAILLRPAGAALPCGASRRATATGRTSHLASMMSEPKRTALGRSGGPGSRRQLAGVADRQRLGGYARNRDRPDDTPISRAFGGGAAGAVRAHGHAGPPRRDATPTRWPIHASRRAADRRLATRHHGNLTEFRLEQGLPVRRSEADGLTVERRAVLLHRQNTLVLNWHLVEGENSGTLHIRPFVHFRWHDARVGEDPGRVYQVTAIGGEHYEIGAGGGSLPLRLLTRGEGSSLTLDGGIHHEIYYATEARRGYDSRGMLWSPGFFSMPLEPDRDVWLIASTEAWDEITAVRPADAVRQEQCARRRS